MGFRQWAATPHGEVMETVTPGSPPPSAAARHGTEAARRKARVSASVEAVDRVRTRNRRRGGNPRAVSLAVRDLATMLGAGLSVDRALHFAAWNATHRDMAADLREVLDHVHRGTRLSSALRRNPRFDPFAVAVVQAGEENGTLDEALTGLAAHYERTESDAVQVRSVLLHPLLMAVLSGIGVIALLWLMVPRFIATLGDVPGGLPLSTRLLVGFSTAVVEGWRAWVPGVVIALGLSRLWMSIARTRRWWHAWRLRLPLVGATEAGLATATFARAFGLLLASGASVAEALRAARGVVTNEALGASLEDAAKAVARGARLSDAVAGALPPLAVELLTTGEESGRLVQMCMRVAEAYDTEARRSLRALAQRLEPMLIVGFGVVAAYVALAMLQALERVNLTLV